MAASHARREHPSTAAGLEVVLGILGIQSAARTAAATHLGARAGSRAASGAAALEQWVRAALLASDEMIRVAYATLLIRRKAGSGDCEDGNEGSGRPQDATGNGGRAAVGPGPAVTSTHLDSAWRGSWGMADHIGLAVVAVGILLILAAPFVTPHGWDTAVATVLQELRPLPM